MTTSFMIKRILVTTAIILVAFGCSSQTKPVAFTVSRDYSPLRDNEQATVVIDYADLVKRNTALRKGMKVMDMNWGKEVPVVFVDSNNDKKPEAIRLDITFTSNEPIYTYYVYPSSSVSTYVKERGTATEKISVTILSRSEDYIKRNPVTSWSDKIIESTMKFYPEPWMLTRYGPDRWNYEYGFFLNATFIRWQQSQNPAYLKYIKGWVDRYIDEEGNLDPKQYKVKEYKLDDILPGRLFISLYEVTGEEKYKRAASILRDHLRNQPKTSDGGYWHKQIYPHQMWLDGIYMGDIFSTHYASVFNEPALIDEAIHQIKLMASHALDEKTGLLYHGWDESKNDVWAHHERGTSPEFWGRAVGWYIMAIAECLEYIPENHPERNDVIELFKQVCAGILRFQDTDVHLWYQVMDKGDQPGNWIETSCSAMFVYAFAKGVANGWLGNEYRIRAEKAYHSLIKSYVFFDDAGKLYFDQTVKIGTLNFKTSKGDFDYYVGTERRVNDYKGLGAFLYASLMMPVITKTAKK